MAAKIANYSTSVPLYQTTGEIQKILVSHGASDIMFQYDGGLLVGVAFRVSGPDGAVAFKLPARWENVQAALKKQGVAKAQRTEEHAQRVAWRLIRDWLRAQMSLLAADMVDLAEVFMPYMLGEGSKTAYELWQRGRLALPRGDDDGDQR